MSQTQQKSKRESTAIERLRAAAAILARGALRSIATPAPEPSGNDAMARTALPAAIPQPSA